MSSIRRILYQEDYRKYKHVKKDLIRYAQDASLDLLNQNLCLLLTRNQHSNGMKLFLPLMIAEIVRDVPERLEYRILHHFKHHSEFPIVFEDKNRQIEVSTNMAVGGVYNWELVIPAYLYINAVARPIGDYSHLTDIQQKKKFNGEKAKIAAKEYLGNLCLSKTVVSQKYGISLSTLTDAIKRLKREREFSEDQNGLMMDYKTAPNQWSKKRVASVALLNVLNAPVSPSKRCKLVPQASFKYNIPERTLRDRLKSFNPSVSKVAEGIRRRKLTPAAEQFLTTFYAMCDAQNMQITVKQADAICTLMAATTESSDYNIFNFEPGPDGGVNLAKLLVDQEMELGKNFGWRFRLRNGFASSKPKKMDSSRLNASNVNNIAMWLSDEAYHVLSSTPPELIYNADEIGFAHTTDISNKHSRYVSVNVSRSRGGKGVIYKAKETGDSLKTLTTVTACVSAVGDIIPPMVTAASSVVKHRLDCITTNSRFECTARQKLNPGASTNVNIAFTHNGWNNSQAFLEYVRWFDKQTRTKATVAGHNGEKPFLRKRVLLVDNHYSHYGKDVLDYVTNNNILLLLLPPNTTHILQPLDVGVFSSLKKQVRNLATEWCPSPEIGFDGKARYGHYDILCNFINALYHVIMHNFPPSTITQAFSNSGIYPPEKALFNPAIRNVIKHFDAHAKLKNIFITNILPLTRCSKTSRRSIAGAHPAVSENLASQIIPLVGDNAFFIGDEEIESLDYLRVNSQDIINQSEELESELQEKAGENNSVEQEGLEIDQTATVDNDFLTKFTFEDVLKMITNLLSSDQNNEQVSLIPKLMERLDVCSKIAFSSRSHFTITREIFLEQQSNVIGIVMYLIYFGACFLGVREQTKIEDTFQAFDDRNTAQKNTFGQPVERSTIDVLHDLSKKQYFKLFPKMSSSVDRDLFKKLSMVQNGPHNSQSLSQEVLNNLGSTVWDFLKDMLRNEHSILSSQPEELKTRVLNTVLNTPAALAKSATVRTIFGQDGNMTLSKSDLPIISKIESINSLPEELLDDTLSDQQFNDKLAALRHAALEAMQDMADDQDDCDSDDGDTLVEDSLLEAEEKNQKLLQNWFLIYHVDNIAARITKGRENEILKRQNTEYLQKIQRLTSAITDMAVNLRANTFLTSQQSSNNVFDAELASTTLV